MSYTGTKTQGGDQAQLSILPTGTTYIPIYEINDLAQSGKMNKTDDATNLNSSGEEFIATLLAPGGFSITMNRVSSDPGQTALLASFNAKTVLPYKVTLALAPGQSTTGDSLAFSALVEEWNDLSSVKADKKITTQAKLKVSGTYTLTPGS